MKTKRGKVYRVQPAPAENVRVCTVCRFDPEGCEHGKKSLIKDRAWFRTACVWCCDWQTRVKEENGSTAD